MRLGVPAETRAGETRVAATAETIKKLVAAGHQVIEASDVRPAVKEQIESLGAKFVDVPYETDEEREIAKCVGGYARPMPESWMKRQSAAVAEKMKPADSSALYARNVLDFLKLVIDKEDRLAINLEDDIVKACLMTQDGQLLRS